MQLSKIHPEHCRCGCRRAMPRATGFARSDRRGLRALRMNLLPIAIAAIGLAFAIWEAAR